MIDPIKILLDECISKKIAPPLQELADKDSARDITFASIFDFGWDHQKDPEWIPKAATDDWIVISTDWGIKNRSVSFRVICEQNGVTYVLMTKAIVHFNQFEKACAILQVKEDLFSLTTAPKGSGYLLGGKPGKYFLRTTPFKRIFGS